jgi:hypothetical protein
MSPPRLAAIAIAIAVAFLIATPAAGAAQLATCGAGVKAAVVGCSKARRIAKEYVKTHDHSIWLYRCSSGSSRGRCVLDRKLIIFPLD